MGGSDFGGGWEAVEAGLGGCSVTNAAALALRLEGSSLSRLCRSFSVRACSALVGVPSGQRKTPTLRRFSSPFVLIVARVRLRSSRRVAPGIAKRRDGARYLRCRSAYAITVWLRQVGRRHSRDQSGDGRYMIWREAGDRALRRSTAFNASRCFRSRGCSALSAVPLILGRLLFAEALMSAHDLVREINELPRDKLVFMLTPSHCRLSHIGR